MMIAVSASSIINTRGCADARHITEKQYSAADINAACTRRRGMSRVPAGACDIRAQLEALEADDG